MHNNLRKLCLNSEKLTVQFYQKLYNIMVEFCYFFLLLTNFVNLTIKKMKCLIY